MCRSTGRTRQGTILLFTLMVLGAIVFFATLYLEVIRSMKQTARHECDQLIVQTAADAGLEDALGLVLDDPARTASLQGNLSSGAVYTVEIPTNNVAGTAVVTEPDGRQVPAGAIHLVSVASYGTASRRAEAIIALGSSDNPTLLSRW